MESVKKHQHLVGENPRVKNQVSDWKFGGSTVSIKVFQLHFTSSLVAASVFACEVQDESILHCMDAARPAGKSARFMQMPFFFLSLFFSKASSKRAASASGAINHGGSGAEGKAHLVHAVPTPGLNKP